MKYRCPLCGCITGNSDYCEICGSKITGRAKPVKDAEPRPKPSFKSRKTVIPPASPTIHVPKFPTLTVKAPTGPAKGWLTLIVFVSVFIGCFYFGSSLGRDTKSKGGIPFSRASRSAPVPQTRKNILPVQQKPDDFTRNRDSTTVPVAASKLDPTQNPASKLDPEQNPASTPARIVRVTVSRANFRQQPAIEPGNIINTLPRNCVALLLERRLSHGTYWYFVNLKGQKGWLSSQTCRVQTARNLNLEARTSSNFFLRREPDWDSSGKLVSIGTPFTVKLITETGWAKIESKTEKQSGYALLCWLNIPPRNQPPPSHKRVARPVRYRKPPAFGRAKKRFFLRQKPSSRARKVKYITYRGERLKVIMATDSGWLKVTDSSGQTGYMPWGMLK
jgi:uncharacterized protein YgiM (DUF1202 family)